MPEANFIEHQKKQKKLMIILGAAVLVILAILYFGSKAPLTSSAGDSYNIKKPEINFNLDILDDPVLTALQPFTEIQPIDPLNATSVPEEIGRDNPFISF
jgi:flagellar basal body-associated protein FliL